MYIIAHMTQAGVLKSSLPTAQHVKLQHYPPQCCILYIHCPKNNLNIFRRRIKTEAKAKVVAVVWETELLQFLQFPCGIRHFPLL